MESVAWLVERQDILSGLFSIVESERMEGVERIWLPGEIEYYRIRERLEKGIPIASAVVDELRKLAGALNTSDQLD